MRSEALYFCRSPDHRAVTGGHAKVAEENLQAFAAIVIAQVVEHAKDLLALNRSRFNMADGTFLADEPVTNPQNEHGKALDACLGRAV